MKYKTWLYGLALGAMGSAAQGAILIDDFNAFQSVTANQGMMIDSSALATVGALGGERELKAMHGAGSTDVSLVSDAGGSSILNYSTGAGTIGMGVVTWDGVNGTGVFDPTGLGGVDLTDGGAALGIVVNVEFDDLPGSLDFIVYTDAGNSSMGSLALPGGIFTNQLLFLPFNAFASKNGSGADFTDVGAIVMNINTNLESIDIQMEFIQADVPEPGALALVGFTGLLGFRRRR